MMKNYIIFVFAIPLLLSFQSHAMESDSSSSMPFKQKTMQMMQGIKDVNQHRQAIRQNIMQQIHYVNTVKQDEGALSVSDCLTVLEALEAASEDPRYQTYLQKIKNFDDEHIKKQTQIVHRYLYKLLSDKLPQFNEEQLSEILKKICLPPEKQSNKHNIEEDEFFDPMSPDDQQHVRYSLSQESSTNNTL